MIPKKILSIFFIGSAVSGAGSIYNAARANDTYNNGLSAELRQKTDELPTLERKIAQCMPATPTAPTLDCLNLKSEYESAQQEIKRISQSENYKREATQILNYQNNMVYFFFGIPVSGIIALAGTYLSARRTIGRLERLQERLEKEKNNENP